MRKCTVMKQVLQDYGYHSVNNDSHLSIVEELYRWNPRRKIRRS